MRLNPGRRERRISAKLTNRKPSNKHYRLAEGKSTDTQLKMMGLSKKGN